MQTLNFTISGLATYSSDLAGLPAGSLRIAKNINLSKLNIAEPRRGYDILANLPSPTDRGSKLFFYSQSILAHYGTVLSIYSGGSFASRGTLSAPSNATSVRSVAMNQNLYLTSSTGIKKMDATGSNIFQAGTPNALHATLSLTSGTNLAVLNTNSVTYRWVLARKDNNKNVIIGGVSPRATITNTAGGTRDVTIRCYLPAGVDSTYYAQIYRTTNSTSTNGEEFQLVLEHSITGAEVTQGYFDEVDLTPDALLGASLYTNPTQQTIANNSAIPPLARDLCEFKGCMFFADVESFHRYTFTLLAVGSSGNQLQVNDTITISNGTTTEIYTAKATEAVGSNQFFCDTASSSPATRIDNTVKSLINVINRRSALVYATIEVASTTDLPGKVTMTGQALGSAAFTVVASRPAAFNPTLASPATLNNTSSASVYMNGLMYSKKNEPEAVPLKNVFFVGSSDDRIKRIVALKDSLLIFKEKDGIYRLSGENEASFTVSLLDATAKLVAPDSIQVLNGLVYGLFEGGVCEISDSDVGIISLPIKDKFLELFGAARDQVKAYTTSIAYETDGKYILCLPSNSADTYSTYQLVYDVFGGSWCEWTLKLIAGGVNPDDGLIYYASGDSSKIRYERRDYTFTDFADFEQTSTLSAVNGLVLTISGTDHMEVGDLLNQGDLLPAYITAVDSSVGTVTVDTEQDWDTGAPVDHYKGIEVEIEWNRETAGNPAGFKHFSEALLAFKSLFIGDATLSFSSDVNPGVNSRTITGPSAPGAWGYGGWDDGVFGGEQAPLPVRVGVPRTSARCNSLTVNFRQRVAWSDFQLSGLSLVFNPTSVRTSR